jgi:hypothetical protein
MKWFFLSSMPPIWRYWPVYLVVISIVAGLVWTGFTFIDLGPDALPSTAPVLFAGVAVAALAIIANTWSQWQTSRISHALQGLQTLRTDREYLVNISVARDAIARSTQTTVGEPLGPDLVKQFLDKDNVSGDVDKPTFRDASLFVLNQYEFLAAATRSGAIDLVLMQRTLRGPIGTLLTTYAEVIVTMRKENTRAFVNLIWLHRVMSGSNKPYLGPISTNS